ncbi:MAG: potassium-transporting ATPase subunit KdpC [Anaerolineae bacterium]
MLKHFRTAVGMLLIMTVLLGGIYPVAMTVIGQVLFPIQANGSLQVKAETVIGSSLIGQANNDPRYFWPRPSAINYNPLPSSGSNLGPTSQTLRDLVVEREQSFREANALSAEVAVPSDMLFASGSGLDPHISPEAARLQANRVAQARQLPLERVLALVEANLEPPQFGVFGSARVNVFMLNLALDNLE